jgi:hypothetical protein
MSHSTLIPDPKVWRSPEEPRVPVDADVEVGYRDTGYELGDRAQLVAVIYHEPFWRRPYGMSWRRRCSDALANSQGPPLRRGGAASASRARIRGGVEHAIFAAASTADGMACRQRTRVPIGA